MENALDLGVARWQDLVAQVRPLADPIARVKAVHDWIILHAAYDVETLDRFERDGTGASVAFRAEGVLERGLAVCAGYADAAQFLFGKVSIEARTVANQTHAWNMVKVAGHWYHLDLTWDDPIPDVPGRVVYDYFLLSTATLRRARTMDAPDHPWAERDYLQDCAEWNGLPIAHTLSDLDRVLERGRRGPDDIQFFTRNLDFQKVVKAAWARLGAAAAGRTAYSHGHEHFRHILIRRGPDTSGAPPGRMRGAWFRLSAGTEAMTISATRRDSRAVLGREEVKRLFGSLKDAEGNPIYKYFAPEVPTLEFRFEPASGWGARVAPSAANGFRLCSAGRADQELNETFKAIDRGDRLVLWSRRLGRTVPGGTFTVTDP